MLRNFFTIAYRSILRQLSYSVINIVGLAIGIACSLIIFLFVYGEWSYDRGFAKGDRIYRVGVSFFNIGQFANGPERLLDILPGEYGGLETATRIRKESELLVTIDGRSFDEKTAYFTDSAFFKVFDFSFVHGSASNVLQRPLEIVLTESLALKYFSTTDALGKTIEIGKDKVPHTVTGVVKDLNFNTHVNAPLWLSIHSKLTGDMAWSSAAFHNYLLLKEGQSESDLVRAIDQMTEKTVFPEFGKNMGITSIEDYRKNDNAVKFYVHPLRDIYLKSKLTSELAPGGNEANIFIFSAIAVFIIVLAAVNFINLATARAARRAKEVGIRKTMGTTRRRLILQFLMESVVMSTAAMLLSLILAEVFLTLFESLMGSPLLQGIWQNPLTVLLFIGFSVVIGILSGLYPAFYLTRFEPVRVLKGNFSGERNSQFRNGLVVFQFTVSIVLIICAVVIQQQLKFMQTRDLGFNQENIMTVNHVDDLGTSAEAFRTELEKEAQVITSSFHGGEPGSRRILSFYTYQTPEMPDALTINTYLGDHNYIPLMGMRMLKGRGFDRDLASDSASIILNEAAVKALGLGEDPIGAKVNEHQKVIGVVSDFHWESLRNTIAPLAIVPSGAQYQLGFKLRPEGAIDFVKTAEAKWKSLVPDQPFNYHFVDRNFGELVDKERTFGTSIQVFTGLAIVISCLGLFGLSAYTTEQRTKEIGIRKVMGASVSNILLMLNRRFTVLVLISALIGTPLAIYISSQWLAGFAYRFEPGVDVYLLSCVLALLVAWVTVGYHSLRASGLNPADTLKYE